MGEGVAQRLTAIDLFCGAGGLSEGLRQAGFSVLGASDVNSLACRTYRSNHKRVKLWEGDVRRLSPRRVMKELGLRSGDLGLLAACPPCQGFSRMRTRNGAQRNRDHRNDLVFEVVRFARSMRPVCVMLENVPGLSRNRRFQRFRTSLESLGYRVVWAVLDTADFGVPQRRRRLVLLASRFGIPSFANASPRRSTVREAIGNLISPAHSKDELHNYVTVRAPAIMSRIRAIPHDGGSRIALGWQDQLACHVRSDGFKDVYGRMAWSEPAPTITCGCINPSKGRFLHPNADRAVTLREAALLQTFPKTYRFPLDRGRYPVAELIGNALPPEFIRRHAAGLRRLISGRVGGC